MAVRFPQSFTEQTVFHYYFRIVHLFDKIQARLAVRRATAPCLGFRRFASTLAFPARDLQ
jgi:hypothetical protein